MTNVKEIEKLVRQEMAHFWFENHSNVWKIMRKMPIYASLSELDKFAFDSIASMVYKDVYDKIAFGKCIAEENKQSEIIEA